MNGKLAILAVLVLVVLGACVCLGGALTTGPSPAPAGAAPNGAARVDHFIPATMSGDFSDTLYVSVGRRPAPSIYIPADGWPWRLKDGPRRSAGIRRFV